MSTVSAVQSNTPEVAAAVAANANPMDAETRAIIFGQPQESDEPKITVSDLVKQLQNSERAKTRAEDAVRKAQRSLEQANIRVETTLAALKVHFGGAN